MSEGGFPSTLNYYTISNNDRTALNTSQKTGANRVAGLGQLRHPSNGGGKFYVEFRRDAVKANAHYGFCSSTYAFFAAP